MRNMTRVFLIVFGTICTVLMGLDPVARSSSAGGLSKECGSLQSVDFTSVVDAPTQLIKTTFVEGDSATPPYCLAEGYVVPTVGFILVLPSLWNGKFMEVGCGGHCGALPNGKLPPRSIWDCGIALRRGYVCVTSDAGHRGAGGDGLWAYGNLQAKIDWGFRAPHVVALAGKALAEHYYGKPIVASYFLGGSTGGRQALQEAQRFPLDFKGIVAIAPPVDLSYVYMSFAWGFQALHDKDGNPLLGGEELKLVTEAALAKCDMDDGVRDGVISDPLHCSFDPESLICKVTSESRCLTPSQVDAVKKVYSGPMTSTGSRLSLGGPVVGSEWGGKDRNPNVGWEFSYLEKSGYQALAIEGLRFLFFWPERIGRWDLHDFDFDHDPQRLEVMQAIFDSSNPDLRAFKAGGGRLLIFQGLNDNSVLPRKTIDYYNTVERTMGGDKQTQSFFRLFLLPGVGHGNGGMGADAVDYLGILEDWMDKDRAPDRIIAAHLKSNSSTNEVAGTTLSFPLDPASVQFTRPVYPYPTRAKYKGRGDTNDANNFEPVAPQ